MESFNQDAVPNFSEQKKKTKALLRPAEIWKKDIETTTDDPVHRLKKKLTYFISKVEANERIENRDRAKELDLERDRYNEVIFNYEKGAGIEGRVVTGAAVMAGGFYDCSSLIVRGGEVVGVLHISPNTIVQPEEGGTEVRDNDIYGHLAYILKRVLDPEGGAEKTKSIYLLPEEIEQLESLIRSGQIKMTMLAGEDKVLPSIAVDLAERARLRGLPEMKIPVHYVGNLGGGGGYKIFASPENVYYVGSNNRVMKEGVNFPPEMFEYKEE